MTTGSLVTLQAPLAGSAKSASSPRASARKVWRRSPAMPADIRYCG